MVACSHWYPVVAQFPKNVLLERPGVATFPKKRRDLRNKRELYT